VSALLRIDQDGLPDGEAGKSRTDGLATGGLVTLTDTSVGGSTDFKLLWTPPGDTTAVPSLAATGDPKVWTFSPTASKYGSYLVELVRNAGLQSETRERRIIAMRTPGRGLIIPALSERGRIGASLDEPGGEELVDNNAEDFADPALNALPFAAWWRAMHELIVAVDHADTLIANTIRSFVGEVTMLGAAWPDGFNGGRCVVSSVACSLGINGDGGEVTLYTSLGGTLMVYPLGYTGVTVPENSTARFAAEDPGDLTLKTQILLGIVGGEPAIGFLGADVVTRRSITGTTTQEQVDSLVAALVALGLCSDDR
jgi:hypothetical protein